MNSEHPKKTIRESLVSQIQKHEVQMTPRAYFVLKVAGFAALTALILILSILICNFISFNLRLNGHEEFLSFGGRGILLFIHFFPWPLVALDIILIILLRFVLKEFSFGYLSPWLPMVGALLLLSVICGAAVDRATPLNDALLHRADAGQLPGPLGAPFQGSRRPPEEGLGEYRGVISSITQTSLSLAVSQEAATTTELLVHIPEKVLDASQTFMVGESVVVLGDNDDGVITAVGIHQIDPNGVPPRSSHSTH